MAAEALPSQTLDRGLQVLIHLRDGEAGVTEIAQALSVHRTNCYRLLRTLEDRGFVTRDARSRRYRLGLTLVEIAASVGADLRSVALPVLERLASETGETAALALPQDGMAVCVERVEGPSMVRVAYRVGTRHELARTAHGRAILARRPPGDGGLRPDDDPSVDRVRLIGYATSHDELERGVTGVAAAVVDRRGLPVGSIGVVGPSARLVPDEAGPLVAAAAAELSRAIGHRAPA